MKKVIFIIAVIMVTSALSVPQKQVRVTEDCVIKSSVMSTAMACGGGDGSGDGGPGYTEIHVLP